MEIITICLCVVIVISMIIMAVLLYNFMQLLSTLNKRLVMVIGDILGNVDLSTPRIDTLEPSQPQVNLEDILEDSEDESGGFNPHNYDPFKEEGIN
jgi:type II secretory pathway component PulK